MSHFDSFFYHTVYFIPPIEGKLKYQFRLLLDILTFIKPRALSRAQSELKVEIITQVGGSGTLIREYFSGRAAD